MSLKKHGEVVEGVPHIWVLGAQSLFLNAQDSTTLSLRLHILGLSVMNHHHSVKGLHQIHMVRSQLCFQLRHLSLRGFQLRFFRLLSGN